MTELPKREPKELTWALRERAKFLSPGEDWSIPATVAMMNEAADMIDALAGASERPRADTSDVYSGPQAKQMIDVRHSPAQTEDR